MPRRAINLTLLVERTAGAAGKRNSYLGKLGVMQQRALADLLLVEGNPLESINLVTDPAKNFKIIMKRGTIYKNMLTVRTC